jgi:HEAT repeat protein
MTHTDESPASPGSGPGTEEEAPERQTTPFLVLQFFIFPMAIVAVCVTVFVIFGLISAEGKTPRTYLAEVRAGGGLFNIKRWQAAFSLANSLETHKDLGRMDPEFTPEVLRLFDESKSDDPLIRRYLALALGRLKDPRAVPHLRQVLQEATPESDSQTVIYSAWALGVMGDASAVPELLVAARSEDPGVRKTAVYALGAFSTDQARSALDTALGDSVPDVRWNAALALGRAGDRRAVPILLQMLDRSHLASVEVKAVGPGGEVRGDRLAEDQIDEAMLQAVAAARGVPDSALRGALQALGASDPSLKVREAARAALEDQASKP